MGQRGEGMVQRFARCYPSFLVDGEHSLEEIDEFPSVSLFRQQLATLDVGRHIHLPDVVQAVEDVLASLLAFVVGFRLVLFRRFQPPEGIGGVDIPVEEFGRLAGTVQHVLGWETLCLRYVPATCNVISKGNHSRLCPVWHKSRLE